MTRRRIPALVLGGLWWWAVLRLVLRPEQAGALEGAVAAGGWGLSLLPVHVAPVTAPWAVAGRDGGGGAGAEDDPGDGRGGGLDGDGEVHRAGPAGAVARVAGWLMGLRRHPGDRAGPGSGAALPYSRGAHGDGPD